MKRWCLVFVGICMCLAVQAATREKVVAYANSLKGLKKAELKQAAYELMREASEKLEKQLGKDHPLAVFAREATQLWQKKINA